MEPPRRRWVWTRRFLIVGGVAGSGVVLTLAGAWVWLQTSWGNRWLTDQVRPVVQGVLAGGTVEIGSIDTNLVGRLEVTGFAMRDPAGKEVIGAEHLEVRYSLWHLLGGTLVVERVNARGLVFDVGTDPDGKTSLTHLFGESDPNAPPGGPWEGLPIDIVVHQVHAEESRVRWATASSAWGADHVSIDGAVSLVGKRIAAYGLQIEGDLTDPTATRLGVGAGTLSWDGDHAEIGGLHAEALDTALRAGGEVNGLAGDPVFDVVLRLDPADLDGVDALLGDIGLGGRWRGPVWATGPLSALKAHVALEGVDGSAGSLVVDASADLKDEHLPWTATLQASAFHAHQAYTPLATMVEALGDTVIVDGVIVASGSGKSWPDGLAIEADWKGGTQQVFGMDFDSVDAQVGLAGGVLTVPSLVTTGPMGDLVASGSIDLAKGPLDLRLKGPVVASELSRFGADGFGGTAWVDARFTGDPRAPDPVYKTTGRIVADDLTYGEDIALAHAEGDVQVRIDERAVRVTGDVTGTDGVAYGVAFASAHEQALVVNVDLATKNVDVGGLATVDGVDLPGVATVATATGPWSVSVPSDGDPTVATHLDFGATEILGVLHGDHGTADATVTADRVGWDVDLYDGDRAVIDTVGGLATADSTIVLDRLHLSPAPGYRYDAVRPVQMRLVDGGIADADVAIDGALGEKIIVRGDLGTTGPLDAQIDVEAFELGVLAAMDPERFGAYSGVASVHAHVGGTADQVVTSGTIAFDGTVLPEQGRPLKVEATFDGADDILAVDASTWIGGEPLVDLSGSLPIKLDLSAPGLDPDGEIDLVADLLPGKLERLQEFVPGVPGGMGSGHVEVHGPIRDPRLDVAAVAEAPIEGWEAPVRIEIGSTRRDGTVTAWGDVYEGYAPRGRLDATADDNLQPWLAYALGEGPQPATDSYASYAESVKAEVAMTGFPVESLVALTGIQLEADGRIDGTVTVAGSPDTPVVQGDLDWLDGHLGEIVVEEGTITIVPVDDGYVLDAKVRTAEGSLSMGGNVPVYIDLRKDPRSWGTGDLALVITADKFPLEVVAAFVPEVSEAKGFLEMKGEVVGPADDPQPSLDLSIVDGSLAYLPLGVRYEEINLTASANRDSIDVTSLTLNTEPIRVGALTRGVAMVGEEAEKNDLTLSGRIGISDWAPTDVAADVDLAGFHAIAVPDQFLVVSGAVDTSGSWPAVAVDGDVTVQSGYWRLDAAAFLSEGPLELDRRLSVHRGGQAYVRPAEKEPPIWHSFDVAVDVEITRNMEISVLFPFLTDYGNIGAALTTANIDARMSGDASFVMRGGDIQLRGDVEIIEGSVEVLQAGFDLEQGTITFQGDPANPYLNLTARMDVTGSGGQSYVEMSVRGPTSEPKVDFSSPDYSSDSQIMAILLTGKPPDELTATQGLQMQQAMMNLLLTSVLGGARLGTVTIDADGTLRVGLPLGRVYAEALWRIDPDIDENHYAVDYEVQLARRFLLDGTVGDREVLLDLMWEYRF